MGGKNLAGPFFPYPEKWKHQPCADGYLGGENLGWPILSPPQQVKASTLPCHEYTYNICFLWGWKQVAQRATIAHPSPMCQGQISFQKIQTHPGFNACSCYMKVSKGFNQKQQRKSGNTNFPIRSIGVFLRRSRAANSVVSGPIWPKFELIHNIMHVLVTSKFEKDRININRDYVMTSIF